MRQIREVLRLKFDRQLSSRQIAGSCGIGRTTVADYLERVEAAGLSWPLAEEWDNARLESLLFSDRRAALRACGTRPLPDFAAVHRELRSHQHVTLQLVWEEYKQDQPEGYQYSQFCERYRQWSKKLDLVLRQSHRAGEKLFVDWAGDKVPIVDPGSGAVDFASVFVAVLGASSYTFAEASLKEDLPSWLQCHVHALEFVEGSPAVLVPDNPRTGVTRACRYEPELNPAYLEFAQHYGLAVIPARPRKPRDKAKAEVGVLLVERWILAALRKRTFFSVSELNEAIRELLIRLNHRPFRKLPGTRAELFEKLDRPVLRPLPAQRFEFGEWKKATVHIDYHVEVDRHYYSVSYRLIGEPVETRTTPTTVEIFHQGRRVASHPRSYVPGTATTLADHRPPSHRHYLEWTPERLIGWSGKVGPATAALITKILDSRRYPEQSFRSCLGVMRLAKGFGEARLEAACRRALRLEACSYKSVKSILQTGLDLHPDPEAPPERAPLVHDNLRGAQYFDGKEESGHVH
jgi:transposase